MSKVPKATRFFIDATTGDMYHAGDTVKAKGRVLEDLITHGFVKMENDDSSTTAKSTKSSSN